MDIEVTSVSRRPEKLLAAASAIQVITGEEIRRAGASSLPEALRLASNLTVAQIDSRQWAIAARGFNNSSTNKLLVQLDGRTLYTPLFAGVFWDVQDTLLDDIDRIEVISGPGATQWGSNAVNGVINITTKSARETQGSLVKGAAGTELKALGAVRHGGTLAPGLFYRVYAQHSERSHSITPAGQSARDDWRITQGGFRTDWERDSEQLVTVQGDLYRGRIGQATNADIRVDGGNLLGRWTHNQGPKSQLKVQAYYDYTHRVIPGSFSERLSTYDFDLQQRLPLGSAHDLVFGGNYRLIDDRVGNPPAFGFLPGEVRREWFGAFVQDELSLSDDRVRLIAGLKIERNPYTGTEVQPSLRAAWKVRDRQLLWAAVSRAMRTPSRIDRDLFFPAVPPFTVAGGPTFKAEELLAYEVGFRAEPVARLAASVAFFFHDYDDLRSVESPPGGPRIERAAFGGARGRGGPVRRARSPVRRHRRPPARYDFPTGPGGDGAEFRSGGLTIVRPVMQNEHRLGTIYLHVDLIGLRDRLLVFGGIVLLILMASVLAAAVLASRLQRPITEPILQLAETARIVSERKDFSVRAPQQAGGEIGTLTTAFNEMLTGMEERRAALMAANQRLQAEVAERQAAETRVTAQVARLGQLNTITRGIAERQDVESVFQAVVGNLEDHLPVDFACVCLYQSDRALLTVASVGRRSAPLAEELGLAPQATIGIDQNGLSRCVRGELVYEPDTAAIAMPFPRRLSAGGLRSLVLAPLLVESRVFGMLVAARRDPSAFSSSECEFLQQLSEHVALAAHQTQLYAALQRAYEDLRRSQQTVMQQERLRALGQMASGIAHDINNAISPVSLYIESMLEREPHLSAHARERLTIVQRAIDDVAQTVSRMRDFYRQRPAESATVRVGLNRMIEQVIDLTKARWFDIPQQRGVVIELRRESAPALPAIKGVESEIREALTNLIFNAVDAMPRGGVLTVRTMAGERVKRDGRGLSGAVAMVEVRDTGTGMSEETLRRCMEPFFTTKGERGTGLGLAMVYGTVQRHGAEIEIESEVGKGTTVRLIFGVAAGDEPLIDLPASAPSANLRLLVIDDDAVLLKSLRDILESDGHTVVTTSGGQDGINTFVSGLSSKPFDAVITDLGMPYIDGRKVAAAVKAAAPGTPVFLLTGWGNRLIAEGEVPAEVDRILSKPPKLRELREALSLVNPPLAL
ncbi:MAG: TonB-dependent receptor [Opitutaceae bacterium]